MEQDKKQIKDEFDPAQNVSLEVFAKDLKNLFQMNVLKEKVRITPQGLFVDLSLKRSLLDKYREWLQEKTQGVAGKSERKCFKRLFSTENPPQYYLVEGKVSFLGCLVPFLVQAPQNFGIPYYLGSLIPADNYLHPKDERLANLPNVEVVPTAEGVEVHLRVKKWRYKVSQASLLSFRAVIERSTRLSKKFPLATKSMLDVVKALGSVLYDAKPVDKRSSILVPQSLPKKRIILRSEDLIFIIDDQERLVFCYEVKGANLFCFLRDELNEATKRKIFNIGSLEISSQNRKYCASLKIKGRRYFMSLNTVRDFAEYCTISQVPYIKVEPAYTIIDCFRALSVICEHSEDIEKKLIERHVSMLRATMSRFMTFEKWIIAITADNCIAHCIEKGAITATGGRWRSSQFGRNTGRRHSHNRHR